MCTFQEYFSCYQLRFDQTIKEDYKKIFWLLIFRTRSFYPKFLYPKFVGLKKCLAPKFFWTQSFVGLIFLNLDFLGQNFLRPNFCFVRPKVFFDLYCFLDQHFWTYIFLTKTTTSWDWAVPSSEKLQLATTSSELGTIYLGILIQPASARAGSLGEL